MVPLRDLTGQAFGSWTVLHRVLDPTVKGARWLCRCTCGVEKIVRASNLTSGNSKSCGLGACNHRYGKPTTSRKFGADHPNWGGDDIKYRGAHLRVRRSRGEAKAQACVDCGSPADQWSYNGLDPNEQQGEHRFSPNPEYYDPRCHSCHSRFDWPQRKKAEPDG